jgi:hypothetical protein
MKAVQDDGKNVLTAMNSSVLSIAIALAKKRESSLNEIETFSVNGDDDGGNCNPLLAAGIE